MPNIDLEPHEFRKPTKDGRRWLQRENPKTFRNYALIPLGMLAMSFFAFDFPDWSAFWVVAGFAFLLGGCIALWLKDVEL